MKKITLSLAAVAMMGALMISCQKEENNLSDTAFTATTESSDSKTQLDGLNLYWKGTEQIVVMGETPSNGVGIFTADCGERATSATFTLTSGQTPSGNSYKALYPADIFDVENNKIVIPAVQQYGNFAMPMMAQSNNHNLDFSNLCGVLRISMSGQNQSAFNSDKLSSITITTDKAIAGDIDAVGLSLMNNNGKYELTVAEATSTTNNSVTLDCSGLDYDFVSATKNFEIYLPTGRYNKFDVVVTTERGYQYTKSLREGNHIDIVRNACLNMNFSVDLYADNTGRLIPKVQLAQFDNYDAVAIRNVAVIRFKLTPTSTVHLKSISIETDKGVWGTFKVINGYVEPQENASEDRKTLYVDCGNTEISSDRYLYCIIPAGTYNVFNVTTTCSDGSTMIMQNTNPITIKNAVYNSLSINLINFTNKGYFVVDETLSENPFSIDWGATGLNVTSGYNSSRHQYIIQPNGITTIPSNFIVGDRSNFQMFVFPYNISTISDAAFQNCTGLKSVTLPYEATTIGNSAFAGCNNLECVTCLAVEPPSLGTNAFSGIASNAVLHVSKQCSSNAYSAWSSYFGGGIYYDLP